MRRITSGFFTACVLTLILSIGGCTGAGRSATAAKSSLPSTIAAKVNGAAISRRALDNELEKRFGKQVLDFIVLETLIDQQAAKEHVTVSGAALDTRMDQYKAQPDFDLQMKMNNMSEADFRERLRLNMVLSSLIGRQMSDADKHAYFDKHQDTLRKVRAYHILLATAPEAEKILAALKNGGDFAALAKAHSIDYATRERGGDLGFIESKGMLPAFWRAAVKLSAGQLSGVVKTPMGYHIIKVTEKQDTYDDLVADIVEQMITPQQQEGYLSNLKKSASIQTNDSIYQ